MKIGTKLLLCMGAVLGIAALVGASTCLFLRSAEKSMEHIVHVTAEKRTLADELSRAASDLLAQERGIVLGSILQQPATVQQSKEQVQNAFARIDAAFKGLEPILETEEDRAVISRLREQFRSVRAAHDEILGHIERQQFDQVQKVFDDRVLPKLLVIGTDCEHLVQTESSRLSSAAKDAQARSITNWWILFVFMGLSAAASAPTLQVVRKINSKLRYIATHMAEGSQQVAAAASEVASASQSLAQGASEQASSLEETAASSEEITSMMQKNAENSRQVAELMTNVDSCVADANRTLQEMVTSMHDINSSSGRISKIIKAIDEIAFQTNILALNAAVEAARAGEAGMGFAVVADEVRNLAQRSAQAASDTADLIEESIANSSGGSAKLNQMESAMHAITQSTSRVRTLADEVSLGSLEQTKGMRHIAKSIALMERMTQKTAANAEETASSSEQLSGQARSMERLVKDLRYMVDRRKTIREFEGEPDLQPVPATVPRRAPNDAPRARRTAPAGEAAAPKKLVNGHAAYSPVFHDSFPMEDHFKEV
jgi:methyl-accepting chemotaxis protein